MQIIIYYNIYCTIRVNSDSVVTASVYLEFMKHYHQRYDFENKLGKAEIFSVDIDSNDETTKYINSHDSKAMLNDTNFIRICVA